VFGQLGQRFIESQKLVGAVVVKAMDGGNVKAIEVEFRPTATVPDSLLSSGVLDKNPPHRLRRSGEKMAAAVPLWFVTYTDQPQVSFVDQACGVEGLPGFLVRKLRCGQLSQLAVDQGEQLLSRLRFAGLDRIEDTGDVGHHP
jgi:hypothetical protein